MSAARNRQPSPRGHPRLGRVLWTMAGILVLAASLLAGYLAIVANWKLKPAAVTYSVAPGMSLRQFSRQLYREDVLPDPFSLVWLAYLQGHARDLKAGEYRFRAGITPLQLLDQVVAGRVVEYPFTIIEGWTFKQVMAALANAPKVQKTLVGLSDKDIMARLGRAGQHPEGRFFPDTYYYARGTTDVQLLERAYSKMATLLEVEWEARDTDVPLRSPDEALTLASIIERETGQENERGLIAGVFVNRLRLGMRLQTDPTVIYGMGERYRGNISLADLRRPTPYNTYVIRGLPPTPIAMPSADAVRAALNPAETDAVYFVSRGDGSHVFSATLAEHNRAVRQYQLSPKPPTQTKASPRR